MMAMRECLRLRSKCVYEIPACRIVKNQDLLEELTKAKSEEEYSCQKNIQKEKMVLNL